MAIACVCIPRFPLALALRARHDLVGRAVVVGGQADERGRVVSCKLCGE